MSKVENYAAVMSSMLARLEVLRETNRFRRPRSDPNSPRPW